MKLRQTAFSVLLPLATLALWTQMLLVPVARVFYAVEHSQRLTVKPSHLRLATLSLNAVAVRRSHMLMGVNLPGMAGEILISLPTSWPDIWHPAQLPLETWRSLSYPVFAMPAWWLVGRGLDGLFRSARLPMVLVVLGAVLACVFTVLFMGLKFGLSSGDSREVGWALFGFAVWAIAFAVLPMAWWRQRRIRQEGEPIGAVHVN